MVNKKVKLNLVGLDGNAFALLGAFQAQARKEGWTAEEIKEVQKKAMSGDYDHLLCTLMEYCDMDIKYEPKKQYDYDKEYEDDEYDEEYEDDEEYENDEEYEDEE